MVPHFATNQAHHSGFSGISLGSRRAESFGRTRVMLWLPGPAPSRRPMSRVRLPHSLAVILLAVGCGHERFDLLPAPDEVADGGMETGGTPAGGRASGGGGGSYPSGGRSERDGGSLPEPDCPEWQPNCAPCWNSYDCAVFGTFCDTFRHYCAPYCGEGFDGTPVRCEVPAWVCDRDREVCVECTIDSHCGADRCELGKCVARPNPECLYSSHCADPTKPVCFGGVCGPCTSDGQCGTDKHCEYGRCEPNSQRP